jgi:hypothetical protein
VNRGGINSNRSEIMIDMKKKCILKILKMVQKYFRKSGFKLKDKT